MSFLNKTEKEVLEDLKILLDFGNISKIKEQLSYIDAGIFKNGGIRNEFKTLKVNIYSVDNINDLKSLLRNFIDHYGKTIIAKVLEETKAKAEELLNEAGKLLRQKTIFTRRRDLLRLAQRCGYDISEEAREGTLVKTKSGAIITVIPRHRDVGRFTAQGIMETLASGERSFRKR